MQMLTKTEFKKELLNKYEISHGLSNDIIDGMISRGFIPSVTNEVGDETYNIDYYIENEDIFDSRLTEYKNTRGYYTDSELKGALVNRDSSFASVSVNAFNDLAKRGLIKKDDFYEVRKNEAYLFASNLIYDIEAIKSAIAELDAQLEAEEADELELLNNDEIIEEDTGAQPEKDSSETKNEDEFEEDEWEYDDYDEQLEKKQKAKKKAQERKKREEALRKEESLKKEAELKAAEKSHAENSFSEFPTTSTSVTVSTEHKTEETTRNTHTETKSEFFKTEKDSSDSTYKEETKQEFTNPTVVSLKTEGKEEYSSSKGDNGQKSISLDKKTYRTVETPKITNVEEHKYVESSSITNMDKTTDGQNKATDYSVPKSSDVIKNKSYDNSVSEDRVKRIKEEVERKKEYEEERRKEHENVKTEEKPKIRNDDGTFTFTGTEIGKTKPTDSSDNKSNSTNDDRTSPPSYSDKTSQRDDIKEKTANQKKAELNYQNAETQPEPIKEKLDTPSYNNKENASREVPTSRDPSVYSESKSGEARTAQTKSDLNKSHSYSSDDNFTSEKQRYDEIAYEEKENKKATEAKREAEIRSDGYQEKKVVNKDGLGYTFTGTSVGKTEYENKNTKESQTIFVDETKAAEGPNRPQQSSRKNGTANDFIDKESDFSVSSRLYSEPSSQEPTTSTVATADKKDSGFARDTVKDSPSSSNEAGQPYKIDIPLADGSYMTFESTRLNADNRSESSKENFETKNQVEVEKKKAGVQNKELTVHDTYDNYTIRTQEAYIASQTVLSQRALDEIVASAAQHSDNNTFKVTLTKADAEGHLKKTEVYNSKNPETFISDISETYKNGNRIDRFPEPSSTQQLNDSKVLFAIGVKSGGVIKDNTFIPPAVPTIHPRIFDELSKQGVEYVSVNGIKVKTEGLAEISKDSFSVIENETEYQNAAVAKELINKATTSFGEKEQAKTLFDKNYVTPNDIKKAEKIITKSLDFEKDAANKLSLGYIRDNPEFVSEFIKEKHNASTDTIDTSNSERTIEVSNRLSKKNILGNAADMHNHNTGYQEPKTAYNVYPQFNNATTVTKIRELASNNVIGSATEMIDTKPVSLDFSKPKEIEAYAIAVEDTHPELSKELRNISKEINGDVAIVLAAQSTNSKLIVDGARLINNPSVYIEGKAENAEIIASAIEKQHPKNAAKIRELSKQLNGDVADIYRGVNNTTGEYILKNPEKFIKNKAADAEAVANAIEERYPETAKKIRELSQKFNAGNSPHQSILKQFNLDETLDNKALKYSTEQIQGLLQNTHVFKGHAKEIEDIASAIEIERPDLAKQLRQASKAQNGAEADIYERASYAGRKLNRLIFKVPEEPIDYDLTVTNDIKPNYFAQTGKIVLGVAQDVDKIDYRKKLSVDNLVASSRLITFTEKDNVGKKHLGIMSFNSDGTINITFDADSKSGAVTIMGYAPNVNKYDDAIVKGALGAKSKLAKSAIRNRNLQEAYFIPSKDAKFALNPEWVKSKRKPNSTKYMKAEKADDITSHLLNRAEKYYKMYYNGWQDKTLRFPLNEDEAANQQANTNQSATNKNKEIKLVEGLRGDELLKKQAIGATKNIARSLAWRLMPIADMQRTPIGTGYNYLLGRGSAVWVVTKFSSAIAAKDELKNLNRDFFNIFGPQKYSIAKNKTLNFNSAKDRREIAKELSLRSKAELKVDITRFTTSELQKILISGKYNGHKLSQGEYKMFEAALKLRGMEDGTLKAFTVYEYLRTKGINPYDPLLSQRYATILGGKRIEELSGKEISEILKHNSHLDKELKEALMTARSLVHDSDRVIYLNVEDENAIATILKMLSREAENSQFKDILNGLTLNELSDAQLKSILSALDVNANEAHAKLAALIQETLGLRSYVEKSAKLSYMAHGTKRLRRYFVDKTVGKLRGFAFGDGLYFFYSKYRNITTAIRVYKSLKTINMVMKTFFKKWFLKGAPGTWRYKILNSKMAKHRKERLVAKLEKKKNKTIKRELKRRQKVEKKAKAIKRVKKAAPKTTRRINKVTGKIRRVNSKFARANRKVRNFRDRLLKKISKKFEKLLNPLKFIGKLTNKVKAAILKAIAPAIPYIVIGVLIVIGSIVGFQLLCGGLGAGLEAVYSVINPVSNNDPNENTGLNVEESLVNNTVEICINLDSAFKYYNEKFYDEKTVINSVKESMKDEGFEKELNEFYDPKANETANIKRLGSTLNKIQTGIYYSYYNGDGKEVGFKSNAKDIASMANAWIGDDYRAKGLYKSYVEKLWNYTHMVAYAPRKQTDNTTEEIVDGHRYNGNTYIYSCPSDQKETECYENAYDYKCNNSGANVYDSSKNIRMDIKNGADKTTPTDKTGTTSGTVIKTLKDKNGIGYLTKSYPVTNGIAEYNKNGCSNDILTYHKGSGNNVSAEVVNSSKGGYNTTKNLPAKSSNRLQNQTITFWSNATKPTGCTHWNKINYAVKVSGTIVEKTAYYCTGCATAHTYKDAEGKDKTYTSLNIANDETIHIVPTIKDIHKGKKATIIGGYTWYAKDSLSGDCSEKKYFTHTLGSSHNGCNNYETIETTNSKTVKCEGTCWLNPKNGKSYYYVTGVSSRKTTWGKVRTANGIERKLLYQADTLKITGTVKAPQGNSMKWPPVSKTMDTSPSNLSNLGTLTYQATGRSANISYTGPVTVGEKQYIYDIRINGNVILDANSDGKITSNDQVEITYYPNKCDGTPADKHKSDYKVTTYNCLGHERCTGYLKNNAQDININYGKNYCPGHTLMHYCTGHVDLNVAVVTLYLKDKNSMAYLGVPKQILSRMETVKAREEFSLTGEADKTLEVQIPKDGTEYLYTHSFANSKFSQFDYVKYPLPDMSIWTNFTIELKGHGVEDPGNFGNPLDTLRWTEEFVKETVKSSKNKTTNKEEKSLDSVIESFFTTFSQSGIWKDENDAAAGIGIKSSPNMFNVAGSYVKNFTGNPDWSKHHYFSGFFKYSVSGTADENGYQTGNLELLGSGSNQYPRDNGPYARAIEATKEDWYVAYKIAFPGAYNAQPDTNEIERLLNNMIAAASGKSYKNTVVSRKNVAETLLRDIGSKYSGSGLKFAVEWYEKFYNAGHSGSIAQLNNVKNAYNQVQGFKSYTYSCRKFRQILGIKSLNEKNNKDKDLIENDICNLAVGDLIGAGDEVYVVLYNDTNSRVYPNGTDTSLRGIEKGHVIVATVNGSGKDTDGDDNTDDEIHLFSFTTEYISKKSELFWVYKNN